jgi:hypothetical protein
MSGSPRRRPGRRRQIPSFLHAALYGSLELSVLLDALNQERNPEHTASRAVADSLVAGNPMRRTVGLFNRYFGRRTIPLRLRMPSGGRQPRDRGQHLGPRPDLPSEAAVPLVLWWFVSSPGPLRLKKCEECPRYFFDTTRNGSKSHCTLACGSRATSRRYRFSA